MSGKEDRLKKFNEQRRVYDKEGAREALKNKLKQSLKKKMTTILVGCVEAVEKKLGNVWGHGKYRDEKNDDELDFTVEWQRCRDLMFDLGNAQIRYMEKELDQYDVDVIKYTIQSNQSLNKELGL